MNKRNENQEKLGQEEKKILEKIRARVNKLLPHGARLTFQW